MNPEAPAIAIFIGIPSVAPPSCFGGVGGSLTVRRCSSTHARSLCAPSPERPTVACSLGRGPTGRRQVVLPTPVPVVPQAVDGLRRHSPTRFVRRQPCH